MQLLLALTIGALTAAGLYMMMRRSVVKLLIGLALLSPAINLLLFAMGKLAPGRAPIVVRGSQHLDPGTSDPLPQALILTAIVISFGVLAFAVTLVVRLVRRVGSDDLNTMTTTERP